MLTKRRALAGGAAALAAIAGLPWLPPSRAAGNFEVTRTEAEWRRRLTAAQFAVLRQSATERPYTSPLNGEHRRGTFTCAGCDRDLFSSTTKFESRTGWPSFWEPLADAIGTESDNSFGTTRTAVHCARCGGHLGHVFDDGPRPTGLRYCMNGVAMNFRAVPA
ncbi:peptide-methionine (R)-S-oxide reductase MsrB [Roseococcus pinisoli]|uniref:peptide-methionine (R)-S-oxide reductase n=1 Tax=Roseococcus pinisoli TaxID=2835040 RepID=A0ABS5QID9_9PROT|nr:peptide-methionine (R)-S-oxide reductase MsrB [Roseococcus pinisoli]MBS7813116.1 peptide-methionine (R)-S-oxide reductase MsrB [Roseococcus pinisoli]